MVFRSGIGRVFGVILLCAVMTISGIATSHAQHNPFARQLRGHREIVRSGMRPMADSLRTMQMDSATVARLSDSLRRLSPDSLRMMNDSMKVMLPDTMRNALFPELMTTYDSLAMAYAPKKDTLKHLSEKERRRIERKANRKPFISDSMALRKVCIASAIMPGFGQIYNKQYWKLPILYGTLGASLGMFLYEHNKYTPLKREFDEITDKGMYRTEYLNSLQRDMIRHNTLRQVFLFTTIASYLYFIGDAAMCYATNNVSNVSRATTLSTICPGAGQIYNKSYWRVPIVLGGFATTIYCIDWNNRGYQRFKKAYRLRQDYEDHPELYPQGSPDEFGGRYSTTFLKNLRNSYRRNRDLCIIITAGLYILQIVDAHVDAHLRDYDITDDLSVDLSPVIDYSYNPMMGVGAATVGINATFKF